MILRSSGKFEDSFFFSKYEKNLLNFDPSSKKSKKFAHIYIYIYIYHGTEETRKTENLKKNVVWKNKGGIWKILIRAPESVKIVTFMESFCPK